MAGRLSVGKRLLFSVIVVGGFYLLCEAVATTAAWFSWWDTSLWLFEDSGRTWRFDPVSGYRLSRTPSRFIRVTNGALEFVGTARGNSQGFADRDDFGPKRPQPDVPRIAVFGDSFTEAQYLGQNWPDRAEDLAREEGKPVELLNFAISGGGLANWWSILTRRLEPERYELDGVIFAVFAGDLRRKFSFYDHTGGDHPLFGRAASWDPATWPTTLAEARPYLEVHPGSILSPEAFEWSLQGHWPRNVPRRVRPFFLTQAWRALRYGWQAPEELSTRPPIDDESDRQRLIADIRRVLNRRQLPVLVVSIPDRPALLDPNHDPGWSKEAKDFAEAIGGTFVDGGEIFARLRPAEVRALFLPHDGHWNQAGSDRFAHFMVPHLDRFPTREPSDPSRIGSAPRSRLQSNEAP